MIPAPFGSCRNRFAVFCFYAVGLLRAQTFPVTAICFLYREVGCARGVLATYSREQGAAGFPGLPLCIVSGLR